jgi:diguanylate cyclase (GGDEF)-like protein
MPTKLLRMFRKSLTTKIFSLCFVCVHIPLIAVIAYLANGFAAEPVPLLLLVLVATLGGTGLCLLGLWWLIRPLRELARAVEDHQALGGPLNLTVRSEDEIGTVAAAVETLVARMDGAVRRLQHQAATDALTGLGNRRWLAERVDDELARASRQTEPLSVVLFDLDLFKTINDSHGHDIGDQVLVAAGQLVRNHLRRYDLAARIGGEEFCVVLPRTRRTDALMIAERLRKALTGLEIAPLPRGEVTASFGVYEAAPGDGLQHILSMADKALYEAKRAGRNRVTDAAQLAADR